MVVAVSFRPQVYMTSTNSVKQEAINNGKSELNEIKSEVKNNQLSDISAMTQRMQIESKIQDAKTEPVKYVEEIKPQRTDFAQQKENIDATKPKTITDVIAKMHKGQVASKPEQTDVLTNQMNMFATSNRILHGLF